MKVVQLATLGTCFGLVMLCPSISAAAAPQVLEKNPVCEASALHFVPCIGSAGAQHCALVGDNERLKELYQYSVSPDGTLIPATPWSLPMGVEISDIEGVTTLNNDIVVVGSHSRKKKGKRELERLRVATLQCGTDSLAKKNLVAVTSEAVWVA